MSNINDLVVHNFTQNIEYIQKNHKTLFDKLSALDNAVNNKHYQEKYELVYENNTFDVLEKETNNYLYNKQLDQHTQLSVNSVNNKLDNNLFEGFIRTDILPNDIIKYKKKKDLSSQFNFTAEIISFTQKHLKETTTIEKYLFFGVGLGMHIMPIVKKIQPSSILIVEDDLELFRLSLFCVNYPEIAQKADITFSVFETKEEFEATAQNFLERKYYLNHYIKYFQLLSHSNEKNNLFYLTLTNQPHLRFLFHDTAKTYIKPIKQFSKNYKILQNSINISSITKPFLLLCSGPSLQKHIKWVENNQDSFTIVAVSSALSYLEKMKIRVDIITHLDPFDASINSFKNIEKLNYFQDAIKLFAISSPEYIIDMFTKSNLFLIEVGTSYQNNSLKISSPCVGSWSLLLLLALKAKEIYLLGLDLALDPQTGKDHIDEHQDQKSLNLKNNDLENSLLKYKESSFEIKGNLHTNVYTTPHFYGSIEIINKYFPKIKQDSQQVYNLSDGAYLNIATPTKIKDILFQKSSSITEERLQNLLEKHTKASLSTDDKNILKEKLKHAQNIKMKIQTLPFTQDKIEIYIEKVINIATSREDLYRYEFSRILDDYLKYISHYLFYSFKHLERSEDKLLLNNIFRYNIDKLADIYIEALSNAPLQGK